MLYILNWPTSPTFIPKHFLSSVNFLKTWRAQFESVNCALSRITRRPRPCTCSPLRRPSFGSSRILFYPTISGSRAVPFPLLAKINWRSREYYLRANWMWFLSAQDPVSFLSRLDTPSENEIGTFVFVFRFPFFCYIESRTRTASFLVLKLMTSIVTTNVRFFHLCLFV